VRKILRGEHIWYFCYSRGENLFLKNFFKHFPYVWNFFWKN
jgi:hypothetical protein